MHWGRVQKIHDDGTVTVKFDVDGKARRTYADAICLPKERHRS
jgi:hypothetical protein